MLSVARLRSGAKIQMPSGSAITIANSRAMTSGKSRTPSRCPEDHRGQYDNEQRSGQRVGQHIDHEAGSGTGIRHGPATDGAYIQTQGFLRGLSAPRTRLGRPGLRRLADPRTASRPQTRTIGPDDDPDFLRRLGHGTIPAPSSRAEFRTGRCADACRKTLGNHCCQLD